jgi:sortase (surface protein transpeptidase)
MSFRSLSRALVVLVAGLAFAGPATSARSTMLVIPRLGLDVAIQPDLSEGPTVYYRDSDTVAIAGHRTTHTHPFLHLPDLRRGDKIQLGDAHYVVRRSRIVRPSQLWVLRYSGLVLSACHPAGSAHFRYVVFAARVD